MFKFFSQKKFLYFENFCMATFLEIDVLKFAVKLYFGNLGKHSCQNTIIKVGFFKVISKILFSEIQFLYTKLY